MSAETPALLADIEAYRQKNRLLKLQLLQKEARRYWPTAITGSHELLDSIWLVETGLLRISQADLHNFCLKLRRFLGQSRVDLHARDAAQAGLTIEIQTYVGAAVD